MNLSIRTRLFILFLVPLGFFLVREGMNIQRHLKEYSTYINQQKNITVMGITADLVTALQRERGISSIFVSSGRNAEQISAERAKVDEVMEIWLKEIAGLAYTKEEGPAIPAALTQVRQKVDAWNGGDFYQVLDSYTQIIRKLLSLSNKAVNQPTIGGIGKSMSSMALMMEAQESVAVVRGTLGSIIASGYRLVDQVRILDLIEQFEGFEINLKSPAIIYSPQTKETIEKILNGRGYQVLEEALYEVVIKNLQINQNRSYSITYEELWQEATGLVGSINEAVRAELENLVDRSKKIAYSYLVDFLITSLVVGSLIVGLLITGFAFSRAIRKPIVQVMHTFDSIAQGQGDLSVELEVPDQSELGLMARYFNQFTGHLSTIIKTIRQETEELRKLGESLSSEMEQSAAATEEIGATLKSIHQNVLHQSASVSESAATIEQFLSNISELKEHIETQSAAVTESSASIRQMLESIKRVQDSLEAGNSKIEALVKASEVGRNTLDPLIVQIGQITEQSRALQEANSLISGIAARTNLLAMNAAIEAAHAGEHGRGFAVVADEIRKLAENAASHSKSIAANLKAIQEVINRVVESSKQVQESFNTISTGVLEVNQNREQIRYAMMEQKAASKEVSTALDEITAITGKVQDFAGETESGSKQIKTEMANLLQVTEEIKQAVSDASRALDEIAAANNHVRTLTLENRDAIQKIYEGFKNFKLKGD
ncbi:MAG: methyl-accepting chemotaxis protein [Breznakiellaceae bacterium]